jgi:hypothetical protein
VVVMAHALATVGQWWRSQNFSSGQIYSIIFASGGERVITKGVPGASIALGFGFIGVVAFAMFSKLPNRFGQEMLRGAVCLGSVFAIKWAAIAIASALWPTVFK